MLTTWWKQCLALCKLLAYRHKLPPSVTGRFYVAFIRPKLEYCSAAWCGASARMLKRLERLQVSIAKAITQKKSRSRACVMLTCLRLVGVDESTVLFFCGNLFMVKGPLNWRPIFRLKQHLGLSNTFALHIHCVFLLQNISPPFYVKLCGIGSHRPFFNVVLYFIVAVFMSEEHPTTRLAWGNWVNPL